MSKEVSERRFAFGRMVKSAAPPADVVQQILEQRNSVRDAKTENGKTENGNAENGKTENGAHNSATNSDAATSADTEAIRRALEPQAQQIESIADGLGQLFDLVVALHDQDAAENKAFDTLHAELSDYKNDFFYERLKPFVRQLLFVCDALEQYGEEISEAAAQGKTLPAAEVKTNVSHCTEQLKDALVLLEMAPVESQSAEFDPKTQRAIEIEAVPAARDNQIVRQVRAGWTMGANLLRPADVVVGKGVSDDR